MKKKQTKAKAKKRNPADTTMRNINALKKRVKKLELESAAHFAHNLFLESRMLNVEKTLKFVCENLK